MKKLLYLFFLLISLGLNAQAQDGSSKNDEHIEMADALRESGKIYIVVGVIVIIFIGILIYLLVLEKKIDKIEKSIDNKEE
jgi:preprotein translocase subunit SecG